MRNIEFAESPDAPAAGGNAPAETQHGSPLKLSSLVGILWRRLWVVLVCTFLAGAIGWVYVRNVTPVYKSTAKVFIDRTGPVLVHRTDDEDMLLKADNFRRTQAEIIKSMSVIGKLADNATLKASDTLANEGDTTAVDLARRNLDTKVGDDDLLYVSFEARSPRDAAALCNAVVECYVQFEKDQHHQTTTDVLKILEKDREDQDADFKDRLKKLTEYRMANGDVAVGTGTSNPVLTQLQQYTDALSRGRLDLLEAQATLTAAQALKDNTESLQQFIHTSNEVSQTEEESAKVRRVRDEMEVEIHTLQEIQEHFTDDYPQVQLHKDRLTNLQKDLEKAEEDYRNAVLLAMSQHVELAQSVVSRLEGLVADQRKTAESLNTNLAQLELLEAELTESKQMLEALNSRIKDLNIGDEAGAMNVTVVEPAAPVSEPFSPNKSKVLRIAIVLGLLTGLVSALSLEMMDDRLRTAESASEATGLTPLSVIPATYKAEPRALGLMVTKEPHSQFAEAFRTLRTAIFFGTLEGQRKTILMTSPLPGEGKSTLTANLAQALAQVGKRTVLLDCDFRRPRAHEEFQLSNEAGISSIISGQEPLEKTLNKNVCPNLDVLTCGPIPPNPSELLNSEAMRTLLAELAGKYEHVIIDSPPVLAVADSRILAAGADVTVLVVRADQTRKKAARQASEHLASVGANVLGMVINCAPRSTDRYGYGAGYGSYAYYAEPNWEKARQGQEVADGVEGDEE